MKKMLTVTVVLMLSLIACNKGGTANVSNMPKPKDFNDQISYMIGTDVGTGLARDSIALNYDYFILGIKNAMNKDSLLMTRPELDTLRKKLQEVMMKKQDARMKQDEMQFRNQGMKNKAEGDKFLSENKNKPGVVTTASGLQYTILKEGNGPVPKMDDKIKLHLKGFYLDGREFDNTYKRQPVVLDVDKQIPGWKEAWTKMKVGSIWRIWLPPALGWGEAGVRPTIPANAVLIFEMEILSIEGKAEAMPANTPRPN